jgi:GntR family transcriptional regulator
MFNYRGGMTAPILRPIKTAKVSLPYQAKQYLHDLIAGGTYLPGQQLPPEEDFAEQLGISRPTLREALYNLEQEGMIVRKHGVGTFVSSNLGQPLESGLEVLETIESMAGRMGLKTQMGRTVIEERAPTPTELTSLSLHEPAPVLSVARTILVDTQPVAYLWDVVPMEFLSREELDEKFTGSVLEMLLKHGTPQLIYSLTQLSAVASDSVLAHQLRIQRGSPLLRLEAKLVSSEQRVVDFSNSYFVPGFFSFHIIRRIGAG